MYAGVQDTVCYCGDSYGEYGPLHESSCDKLCPGDVTQNCGGEMANSVYRKSPFGG